MAGTVRRPLSHRLRQPARRGVAPAQLRRLRRPDSLRGDRPPVRRAQRALSARQPRPCRRNRPQSPARGRRTVHLHEQHRRLRRQRAAGKGKNHRGRDRPRADERLRTVEAGSRKENRRARRSGVQDRRRSRAADLRPGLQGELSRADRMRAPPADFPQSGKPPQHDLYRQPLRTASPDRRPGGFRHVLPAKRSVRRHFRSGALSGRASDFSIPRCIFCAASRRPSTKPSDPSATLGS